MERNSLFIFTIIFAGCFVTVAHCQTTLWNQQTGIEIPTIIWNAGAWYNGTNSTAVVETIDDFVVNATQRWKLSSVSVTGAMLFSSAGYYNTFAGWRVKIYNSVNDSTTWTQTYEFPGTVLYDVNGVIANPFVTSPTIGLDPYNIVLDPGRYWVSVLPIIGSKNTSIYWGPCLRNTTQNGRIGKPLSYIEYFYKNTPLPAGLYVGIYIPQDAWNPPSNNTQDMTFSLTGTTYTYDATPPTLNKLTITPQTVNLGTSSRDVNIFANFTDPSGISAASVYLRSPSSTYYPLNLSVVTGTTWGATFTLPSNYSEAGTWIVQNLTGIDNAQPAGFKNNKTWTNLELSLGGNDFNINAVMSPSPSATPSSSTTPSPSSSPSISPSSTPSQSPGASPSSSPSASPSFIPPSSSPSSNPLVSPSPSPSPSSTPSLNPNPSQSATPSAEAANGKKNNGANTTAIAVGVVLGVVICGGAMVAGLFVFFLRRRRHANKEFGQEMGAPPQYHSSQLGLVVRGSEIDNGNNPGSPGSTSGNVTPRASAYNTIPVETSGNSSGSGSRGNLNSVLFANRQDDPNNNSGPKDYHNVNAVPNPGGSTSYGSIPVPRDAPTGYGSINTVALLAAKRESFEIDYNELEFEKEVGRGAYGVVYKGKWRGGEVAIKQVLTRSTITEKEITEFKTEAALMAKLRPHTNVVQFLGITLAPQLCIVTEFLEYGSLFDYVRNTGKMDAALLASMVKGIAAGMLHLHREGIIHRDLAARNILLGKGYQVKISDFGMSRMTEGGSSSQTKSDTGPLKWMAPECIRSRQYSVKSDVWAFGVTIWEVVTRQEPYPDLDAVQTALEVTHNGRRLEIPEYCPPVLKEVMASCFQTVPEDRPDFDAINKKLSAAGLDKWSGPFNAISTNSNVAPSSPAQQTQAPPPSSSNSGSQQYGSLN